ncbi:carboxypeptidase regulatory-like domain-containing protein [Candidatus Daviesbacteria bacterium]|nr:carboxypeptidase regulatory-like domain-containing protein [Candidatus Daviesbacteria bacterium]
MKKLALLASIIAVFGILMVSQISVVNASANTNSPLTIPVSYFSISGHVVYKLLGQFSPASNITVSAVNLDTNEKTSDLTGQAGRYSFTLKNGHYAISAEDSTKFSFNPAQHLVNLMTHNVVDVNFEGNPK